ncbi:MAG TPA: immunoglobulin domain-containing protein, partial [Verrucomicrobiae bacterium]|nr:immunoglobulin domain-containing protein [Verrucomicrobiae bacterium]
RGPLSLLGTTTGNNIGATSEPGEPLHAGVPGGKSVWFKWTPLLSGVATFSTAGSSFDTLLAVYTGNSLTNLAPVASDDDQGGYYTSEVTFNAVGGTTYSIAVDGAYGASGNIVLTSSQQLLTAPAPQIVTQPGSQIAGFGGTAQFSVVASGSHVAYQWYFNGQAIAGATNASLQINNVSSSQVGLYYVRVSSGGHNILSESANLQISITDGNVNGNLSAMDKFQSVAWPISGGAVTKSVTKYVSSKTLTSSVAKDSTTSRGYSSTQVFSTYASQTQSSEPNNCDNPGGSSSWTSITAPDNGLLVINTYGSNFRAILGAYTGNGSSFSSLTPVACDVGTGTGGASNAAVSFAATSNTVYYISVDGYNGAYGTVVLNWSLNTSPAIVSQPKSLTASPGSTVSLNASATGHATPNCQWLFNGAPIPGGTNGTLTITNFQSSKVGNYQMKATNALGWVTTTPASVLLNSSLHLDSCGVISTNHLFQMRVVGIANTNYTILASTDLKHWTPIATNSSSTGLWTFSDAQSTKFGQRFYRVVTGP